MELNRTKFPFFLLFPLAWVSTSTGLTLFSIGAIVNNRSRIGREQIVALEAAVRDFSNSSLLLSTTELKSTAPLEAASCAQELIRQGAKVILTTGTWPQVLGISDVGKRQQVPTISLTPSAFLTNPFMVQMSYPDSALVNCFAAIVKSYKWRRVIIVYEDDIFETVSGTAQLLSHALQEVGAQIEHSLVFPPMDSESDPSIIIEKKFHHMKECRVISTVYIVIRMSENLILSLFKEAIALEILHNGSAWICGPDVITLLDSTSIDSSFISKYMQGIIGVQPYVNESTTEYMKFKCSFKKTLKIENENNNEPTFNPGVYSVRAYDVMHAITLAVNRAKMNSSLLVKSMLASNFIGLSGYVAPLKYGRTNKTNSNSIFQVVNVVGKSYKEIGFWSTSSRFYKGSQLNLNAPSSLEQLSVVLWPGEATKTPPAGVRELKIGVLNDTIWGEWKTMEINDEIINITSISGFCIDVFIAAMNNLNMGISYHFNIYSKTEIRSYNNFVNKVNSEEVDIVVGDVTVTSERMDNVSFTAPFIDSGISTIFRLERQNVGLMLQKPFTLNLWITIFLLLFYNFGVIWYLERNVKQSEEHFQGPWYGQVGAAFWIIGNTIFQNFSHKIGSFYSKTVIISWLVVVLIISNCFTANLSSILVANQLKPMVDTSKIGYDGDSFVLYYLTHALKINYQSIVRISSPDEYVDAFENGTITAAYLESPYVQEFLSKHKIYAVYGETQMLGGFAFVLRKGDPMTADLSKAIIELQEEGKIKELEEKWFSSTVSTIGTVKGETASQQLGLDAFWILFVFSTVVSLITLVAFIVQKHVIAKRKKKQIVPCFEEEMLQVSQIRQTNGARMHEL